MLQLLEAMPVVLHWVAAAVAMVSHSRRCDVLTLPPRLALMLVSALLTGAVIRAS